jgi:hypothetical protein
MGSSRYTAKQDVVAQTSAEGFILVDVSTQDIFELNETAQRIWELLVAGKAGQEIVAALFDEYEATEDQISECVDETIAELLEQGLLLETQR